ncbi:twin-arginine leader-binding protein for DmsA and TorA [Vibrio inusitatus NBRC 102082]|uniref:Twin-arginine leader-binding protein for DmsA and TorA n=1 Tax=Vibrio inusitatus NBRC 102082 TaxID=1219070 RepID=A0A4Y3HSX0_9VIBR|nr:molecular chaperone TorD family protein [Vibrio inusitatus]GEA50158.1 twin-arginine leader-binding protein for DmsA and TorA [Vibrio inusitatus NBRC 102082]
MILNTAKLVGSLFYERWKKQELIQVLVALAEENIVSQQCVDALEVQSEESLEHSFSHLFEGLGDMPAPPWGSVYLDKDRVVFGESTVEYRAFLKSHGISLDTGLREPEDQFGLTLYAFSQLLAEEKEQAANHLLEYHLLPWAIPYLELLSKKADNVFYSALAVDIKTWLVGIASDLQLNIVNRKLYLD